MLAHVADMARRSLSAGQFWCGCQDGRNIEQYLAAEFAVFGAATPYCGRGSVPVDLAAIPLSAIERIDVLRDGAAAQYGSDAIANPEVGAVGANGREFFARASMRF